MDLESNLNQINQKIAAACNRTGRNPAHVQIIAVSKGHSAERVAELAQLGVRVFGENKVQEAKAKIPQCHGSLEWHMIGHLQTNKVKDTLRLFRMVQSVDSLKLAAELHAQAEKDAKYLPVLIEVNVAGEASKFGYRPENLLAELDQLNALSRLEIHGLMTIAPWTAEPEKVRPIFRQLRELKTECEQRLGAPLQHLSMGMSGDYEIAIEEGATMVRIGTALFGPR